MDEKKIPAKLVTPRQVEYNAEVKWGTCPKHGCNCGDDHQHVFRGKREFASFEDFEDALQHGAGGEIEPIRCVACQEEVSGEERDVNVTWWLESVFDRALEPGDLYYRYHEVDRCHYWDNCDGRHLILVLPNGHHWDIDSKASNCTMVSDRLHRCWCRHGDPALGEPVHVDKLGLSCLAGAGSIDLDGWHGFLHRGFVTKTRD